MTRRDWWAGIAVVVALGLFACWFVPRRMGAGMVDGAAERMQQLSNDNASSDKNAAATQIGFYARAADRFRLDAKRYPTKLEELAVEQKYMNNIATDPWDHAYSYVMPGKHNPDSFDVWSFGPNGVDGTADDIGNWERN